MNPDAFSANWSKIDTAGVTSEGMWAGLPGNVLVTAVPIPKATVDKQAALSSGTIAAAALDDLEEEPAKRADCTSGNSLLRHPNVIVTPHAAYYSEHSIHTIRAIAAEEAVRVLTGQAPRLAGEPPALAGTCMTCARSGRMVIRPPEGRFTQNPP